MNGLTARALESFVRITYGEAMWQRIVAGAKLNFDSFELMLTYPVECTEGVIRSAAENLSRTREDVLEDLGIYLVSHPATERLRRLLRYGGADFLGFLCSLGELPDRARLALPHAILPEIQPINDGEGRWTIVCGRVPDGFVHVLHGAIRAMADDYGALVTVDVVTDHADGPYRILVEILSDSFTQGRQFDLKIPAE